MRFWIATAAAPLISAAVLFGCAGTLAWPGGWLFVGVSAVGALVGALVIGPELAAERGGIGEGTERWDLVLAPIVARVGPLAILVVAGLDRRAAESAAAGGAALAAAVGVLVASAALTCWAMASNRFFAPVVRIQLERGQVPIDRGPYAYVRHPGYTGMVGFTLATPAVLGSDLAWIPVALTVAATVVRTALEDRTLRRGLDGYASYAARVRFRLLPGLW